MQNNNTIRNAIMGVGLALGGAGIAVGAGASIAYLINRRPVDGPLAPTSPTNYNYQRNPPPIPSFRQTQYQRLFPLDKQLQSRSFFQKTNYTQPISYKQRKQSKKSIDTTLQQIQHNHLKRFPYTLAQERFLAQRKKKILIQKQQLQQQYWKMHFKRPAKTKIVSFDLPEEDEIQERKQPKYQKNKKVSKYKNKIVRSIDKVAKKKSEQLEKNRWAFWRKKKKLSESSFSSSYKSNTTSGLPSPRTQQIGFSYRDIPFTRPISESAGSQTIFDRKGNSHEGTFGSFSSKDYKGKWREESTYSEDQDYDEVTQSQRVPLFTAYQDYPIRQLSQQQLHSYNLVKQTILQAKQYSSRINSFQQTSASKNKRVFFDRQQSDLRQKHQQSLNILRGYFQNMQLKQQMLDSISSKSKEPTKTINEVKNIQINRKSSIFNNLFNRI